MESWISVRSGFTLASAERVFPLPLRERARVRVIHNFDDMLWNTMRIGQHLIVPVTEEPIAHPSPPEGRGVCHAS